MKINQNSISLGCGLIRIGRTWGYKESKPPTTSDVQLFLEEAVKQGVTFFDTAPAYGSSEERLGNFLNTLTPKVRANLIIATKCGEIWDDEKQKTVVDHSYDTLTKSIDKSLKLLGKIDILQIHKSTPEVLKSANIKEALQYASDKGMKQFGASVSDKETVEVVLEMEQISIVQLPYNQLNDKSKTQFLTNAYQFILKENFKGVILTGTANTSHLRENLKAFIAAHNTLA